MTKAHKDAHIAQVASGTRSSEPTGNGAQQIELACRQVAIGKRAAQDVTAWGRDHKLTETAFRLLWLLSQGRGQDDASEPVSEFKQRRLAEALAVSPAQLSNCVASLAQRGLLQFWRRQNDRRRQLCQATPEGRRLMAAIARQVGNHGAEKAASAAIPNEFQEKEVA